MVQRGRKSSANLTVTPIHATPTQSDRPVPAPAHLSVTMKAWWDAVLAELNLEPHRIHLLELACGAFDRAEQARELLAENGLTFEGEHGPKARPEVAIERDSRIAFARLVRELGLDDPIPQPPNVIGYAAPPARPWQSR